MKNQTIGQILRLERQSSHISLGRMSEETNIKLSLLESLEKDDFAQLPSAAYVKGYIKAYCRTLGLDDRVLLAILRRDYKESSKGVLVPREFLKAVRKKPISWTPITWLILLGTIFVCVGMFSVFIQWYRVTRPPQLVILEPESRAEVSANVQVRGFTDAEAVLTINNEIVSVQRDGSFVYTINFPLEGLGILNIEATDKNNRISKEQLIVYVHY